MNVNNIVIICLAFLLLLPAWAENDAKNRQKVNMAIAGGLKWLADSQVQEGNTKGSWDSEKFRVATASFAGLAFLANAHKPGKGEYGKVLDQTMDYVMKQMAPDGYLGSQDQQMYVHAVATLFALSYLGRSDDADKEKKLAAWCQKSIGLIIKAQKVAMKRQLALGGWRYSPDTSESDTSVTCWMLLVLHTAKQAGFTIDQGIFDEGLKYINNAWMIRKVDIYDDKGQATGRKKEIKGFVYRKGVSLEPEAAATGIAVFVKSILEKKRDSKVNESLAYLKNYPPVWGAEHYNGYFFFASFYITQGMFQIGGDEWIDYRNKMNKALLENQKGNGRWPLPDNNKGQSSKAGLAYPTAMAILILSLEKQLLPMYQRQKELF
ncbi:MAG: hypothetical protein HRT89_14435 [Lentisphaeria bacterium]|nr:hypothetical protein [Lentisphaeria bacterium]NQZ69255.1 hypothetical protein [Lentisphaeria bacterium]